MNVFQHLPLVARLVLLFAGGCLVGGQINRCIYRLAFFPRRIGPWTNPEAAAAQRRWYDRLPIVGWLGLSRESALHGSGYWVRPLLIELVTGILFPLWYVHTLTQGVIPPGALQAPPGLDTLHAQFASQVLLFSLMMVATFIDFDEQTIPDSITIPGTLLGLLLAALLPVSLPREGFGDNILWLTSPHPWDSGCDGFGGLAIGLVLFNCWILAVLPKTWYPARGLKKALLYMVESIRRSDLSRWYGLLAVAGSLGIVGAWCVGQTYWQGLLTSLVGMAGGAAMIWSIRIAGSSALGQEAMGFGDVTLMGMIGAFIGWQMSMLVFFLAPLAGVMIALVQWLITRRHDIAYGPYLCLATCAMLANWSWFWTFRAAGTFWLGWWIPLLFALCVFLIWLLLTLWRRLLGLFGIER